MNNPTLGGSCTARMSRADSDVSNRVVDVFELEYSHDKWHFALASKLHNCALNDFSTL